MDCPRCQQVLNVSHCATRYGGHVEVDSCGGCGGKWIDGAEVGQLYPALANHRLRLEELVAAGARRGRGLGSCPRCGGENVVFPYFEHWLDLCSACFGMWIDGPELALLAEQGHVSDGLGQTASRRQTLCHECAQPAGGYAVMALAGGGTGPVCLDCQRRRSGAHDGDDDSSDSEDVAGEVVAGVAFGILGGLLEAIVEGAFDA